MGGELTRKHTPAWDGLDYGYQWWIFPSLKGYAALGLMWQAILVIPGSDLVVVAAAQIFNQEKIM